VPSLEALLKSTAEVSGVVTNPDRPAGRGMRPRPSPVKIAAEDAGLEVVQPQSGRDPELETWIRAKAPDVAVVVAYGYILPPELLEIPRRGFVNVHFSLLPEYRGAAPVQRAIIDGRQTTGVSVMVLTEGMDEGPVLGATQTEIDPEETAGDLGERLARAGAELLIETLEPYVGGRLESTPQDDARATYAPKITSRHARVYWDRPAEEIRNLVRGLNPIPGSWTTFRGERVKLYQTSLAPQAPELEAGEIAAGKQGLFAGTGRGTLRIDSAQMRGRRRLSGEELARGLRLRAGERFE
jgi:methionyl-tRNA formyltransferase